jgi:hypothetical protein
MLDTAIKGEREALVTQFLGKERASALRAEGKAMATAGYLGAAGTLLSTAGQAYGMKFG